MIRSIIRPLCVSLLTLFLTFSGYALEEKQKLSGDSQKSSIETGAGLRSVLFDSVSREMLRKYDEKIGKFSWPKQQEYEKPAAKRRKMHEVSLLGSYVISMGSSTLEAGVSDLFTGRWSPWFGQGYKDFHWSRSLPRPLDSVIGAEVITQKNVFLTGFKFAINVLPRFQVELLFQGGDSVYQFNDEAWEMIKSILPDSAETLREDDRDVTYVNLSEKFSGDLNIFGLNINYNILDKGPLIPFVSLGFLIVDHEGTPSIDFNLIQHLEGLGAAKYILIVDYDPGDESLVPNFGLGTKIFLVKNLGIKVEARAAFEAVSLHQQVATDFERDSWMWLDYDGFYDVAATQKIKRFMIEGGIGLFFRW